MPHQQFSNSSKWALLIFETTLTFTVHCSVILQTDFLFWKSGTSTFFSLAYFHIYWLFYTWKKIQLLAVFTTLILLGSLGYKVSSKNTTNPKAHWCSSKLFWTISKLFWVQVLDLRVEYSRLIALSCVSASRRRCCICCCYSRVCRPWFEQTKLSWAPS